MRAAYATSGAAAAALAGRYWRDLGRARSRLARLERRSTGTPFGPVEYCEWGEGEPLLLIHGVVGGCDVPPSWRARVPAGFQIITPSRFGYLGSPLPEKPTVVARADAFVWLFNALGIEQAPVPASSAGTASAVQLDEQVRREIAAFLAANPPSRSRNTCSTLVPTKGGGERRP